MNRSIAALVLVVCGGLTLVGCKKKEEEGSTTGGAAASATAVATATATAADTATAPPADTAAPSATPSAEPTAAPVVPTGGGSIDACCAALDSVHSSGRGKDAKRKASTAAKVCHSAAPRVRSGQTSRQSALQSVRAQLHGTDVPGVCQ